ncbi:MAG TPA: protease pro-enzyme activation domain-containing protein [Terracidiphilus sp.]|nr:protease pro-enzyme activation domain-containing protein [Terracidiphilus sp.]
MPISPQPHAAGADGDGEIADLSSRCSFSDFPLTNWQQQNPCRRPFGFFLAGGLLLWLFLAHASLAESQAPSLVIAPIDLSRVQALPNHHPQWANAGNDAGALPADQAVGGLALVLARSPAQDAAFKQFLADQQNPASPDYHHWLTAAEIGERFGPSDADVAAIKGWLQSDGLQVTWVAPSKTFVGFGGTAASVSLAFQAPLHYYLVNGRKAMSVSSDPMVPQALALAIKAIHGLYEIHDEPQSQMQVMQMDAPAITTSNGTHFIGPGDFYNIYSLPNGLTGAGVTIGIVARSRTDAADFDNFKSRPGGSFTDPTGGGSDGIWWSRSRTGIRGSSGCGNFCWRPGRSDAGCGARRQRCPRRTTAAGGGHEGEWRHRGGLAVFGPDRAHTGTSDEHQLRLL